MPELSEQPSFEFLPKVTRSSECTATSPLAADVIALPLCLHSEKMCSTLVRYTK